MKQCVVDPKHQASAKRFTIKATDIYICPDCNCIMADIDFYHDQYESDRYYTMHQETLRGIEYEWGFRWRYILNKIVKLSGCGSLLDVGAGNGYFGALASREYGMNVNGLEISREQIQFAQDVIGVHLINEDVADHSTEYDVVTCFNVLEHVNDPHLFMSALVKRVRPGGILVITTPNPRCIHARVKGLKNWNMIDPPHHINLFTQESLDYLIRAEELTSICYETLSTYINFVRKVDGSDLFLRKLFFNLLRIFSLGADHLFILRKPF
jgi:2-polyprenyl-3-methyl-5-hydroxy-6-metoxy-1,4-benzoquinol methylase